MQEKTKHYIDSLRLGRWPRSLAIIPGFIAALLFDPVNINNSYFLISLKVLIAFLLTWSISTANYIINEIADAPHDAFHPGKKHRPLVMNKISKKVLLSVWFVMVIVTFTVAYVFFNEINFLLSLALLLIAGFIYNVKPIRVKDIPYLDSTIESANNPIRFLIGWYIIATAFPSPYLLISWWAFGNFLMVGKRVAEKKFLSEKESAGYRASLKKYTQNNLMSFMILNCLIFLATFIVFALEKELTTFLYALPFIIFYLLMFFKKSVQDRDAAEEPEKLLKNPYFAIYTLFLVIIFILAYLIHR